MDIEAKTESLGHLSGLNQKLVFNFNTLKGILFN
jgi:hypothetical protein